MNEEVTKLLDNASLPFRKEIEELRSIVLDASKDISENVKWNGPNYHVNGEDRVTIKVQPAKSFYLILHMGAKTKDVKERPPIQDHGILEWKSNDRAIIGFKDTDSFNKQKEHLNVIVKDWLAATL